MIRIDIFALALALVLAATACQRDGDDSDPRQVSSEDGISFAKLNGWTTRRDRETLILAGNPDREKSRTTIAIRSTPVDGWSEPREPDNVLPSVESVLKALPGAVVTGPEEVEHPTYRAVAYDVVFTPRSRKGQRYQRRHIVLFGETKVVHVFATSPEGQLEKTRQDFEKVVTTIREEG